MLFNHCKSFKMKIITLIFWSTKEVYIVLMKKYKYLKHVLINIYVQEAQSSCLKAISLSWFLSQSAKTCQSLSTVLGILDTNM